MKIDSRDRKLAFYIINEISDNISKILNLEVSSDTLKSILKSVLLHYKKHKDEYNVCVSDIDPYKFCAWSAEIFIKELQNDKVIVPIIITMEQFLRIENRKFEFNFLLQILKMYQNNNKKDEFAIGKNGLYTTYSAGSNVEFEKGKQ